jgi:hypothetical protein
MVVVAVARSVVTTMETTGTTGTSEMGRTTGTSEMRRTTEARMRRTTGARMRRTTEARARRRTAEWLGERGIWRDCCSGEHHARAQGQKGLPQSSVSFDPDAGEHAAGGSRYNAIVWPEFVAIWLIGTILFALASPGSARPSPR